MRAGELLTFNPDCGILVLEAEVIDRIPGKSVLVRYLLLALVGTLVVYVGAAFARQAQVREQQRAELERIENEIAVAQEEAEVLNEHLEFVESPAAVEAWALENGWARPDEMPVVIIEPTGEAAPGQDARDGAGAGLAAPQQAWWDLFFGDR